MADTCATHLGIPAVAECELCGAPVCRRCTTYLVDGRLGCERCGDRRLALVAPRWKLGAVVLTGGLGTTLAFSGPLRTTDVAIATVGSVLLAARAAMPPSAKHWTLEKREPGAPLPERSSLDDPYRARRDRPDAAPPKRPAVSGKAVAILLGFCLLVAALLVPFVLDLPAWIEWELVLVGWWLLGAATLSALLYRGWGLRDDHAFARIGLVPRNGWRSESPKKSDGQGWSVAHFGCLAAFGEIAVVFAVLFLALAAIDFVLPAVAFLAYFAIHGAIARVVNDEHGCEHDRARAMLWGTLWATLHVAPLALVVWILHLIVRLKAG